MSDNKDQVQEQETQTNEQEKATQEQPKQTNKDRRQERKEQQQQNQRGTESENQAPAGLFAKSSKEDGVVKEDPEAVTIIKAQIDAYVKDCGKGSGETKEAQMATRGLHKAVRNLCKLRGQSLKQAFSYLYKAIKADETGAFKVPFPFRWGHEISGEQERKAYTSFMNLVLQYAKLQNPAYIHERVDVERSLAFIKDVNARTDMLKQFASK